MSIEEIWQYLQQFDREKLWIVYIFAIIFVALLVDMVQKIVLGQVQKRLTSTTNVWDDALIHAVESFTSKNATSIVLLPLLRKTFCTNMRSPVRNWIAPRPML